MYTPPMRAIGWLVVGFVAFGSTRAFGADAPAPPPPYAPPPGAPPPPPAQQWYPPPPGYAYPPPYYGGPYNLNPQSLFIYENQKKNPAIALVLEFVIPGVGSIYADHAAGAAITWGLAIGGFAVIIWGVKRASDQQAQCEAANQAQGVYSPCSSHVDVAPILLGVLAILGGRIYGFVDAYTSAGDYNRALAQRLGLPGTVSLGVTPLRVGESLAYGPSLQLRF